MRRPPIDPETWVLISQNTPKSLCELRNSGTDGYGMLEQAELPLIRVSCAGISFGAKERDRLMTVLLRRNPSGSSILALLGLVFAAGCAHRAVSEAEPKVASVATELPTKRILIFDDIAYRSGDSKAWRLDLAMIEPTDTRKRPAIVIIHGGGWRAGSKRDRAYRDLLLHFALKGYVTISVDYRLTGEAPIPACLEDVK